MTNANPRIIKLLPTVGAFAENKDIGRDIRLNEIEPSLKNNQDVVLDFEGVDGATQSFVHSLISQVIRDNGSNVLEKIFFKNCADDVRAIINIVVDYMQQTD